MIYNTFQDIRLSGLGFGAMHSMPLLCQPLPDESGYSSFAVSVQRACVYRRRVHCSHGSERTAA